jgi:transposase
MAEEQVGEEERPDVGGTLSSLFPQVWRDRLSSDDRTCGAWSIAVAAKKKTTRAAQRDKPATQVMRKEYQGETQKLAKNRLVFVDEAGCQLGMDRRYARAPVGERAHGVRPFFHGDQVNLIGAIGLKTVRCMMTLEGNIDGLAFEVFAQDFLAPQLQSGDVVIWDRLPAHRMESIRKIIEATGARVLLLPPYSPDLNPIELMWSKLKEIIRGFAPKTIRAFYKALSVALSQITSSDLTGWFGHCGYQHQNAWSALYAAVQRDSERKEFLPFLGSHQLLV